MTPTSTLAQAFTLPTDAGFVCSDIHVLRLSHEGHIQDAHYDIDLIRNAIVDPINGVTTIRLLNHKLVGENVRLSCIDLTLPKHTPADMNTVLPMTINMHGVLEAEKCLLSPRCHVRGPCRFFR